MSEWAGLGFGVRVTAKIKTRGNRPKAIQGPTNLQVQQQHGEEGDSAMEKKDRDSAQ